MRNIRWHLKWQFSGFWTLPHHCQRVPTFCLHAHGRWTSATCSPSKVSYHTNSQFLSSSHSSQTSDMSGKKQKLVDLSAMTVISSPVALMVQLYCGTSAASISLTESSFLSSMLRGAGREPSLAFALRISLNQVLIAPSSSRVPGIVVCSEKGKVMNLAMRRRGV